MAGKAITAADVEAYLAALPQDKRRALQQLRGWIRAAAPGATEGFSYGGPAFKLGAKPLACYAAFKAHCGFYPMSPAVIAAHAEELASFETD